MSNGGAQTASGIVAYRVGRELGSRSPRSYAAVREPSELVVIHRFSRSADPRAKSTASFVSADGAISLGGEAMANLVRDARCLATNWHPNIARVRHVDIVGDEVTVATELVDGATLDELLRAAAAERARSATKVDEPLLPLPILVRILVDVVTGLSGLHGLRDEKGAPLGTIHGALSPANIVIGKDGVARLLNALRPRPLRAAAGTEAVGYAAPEALDLGATQDVRADLHSVGVIMWEALNGRRLYDETDPARVLARQREEDVAPPTFPAGSPFTRLAEVTMRAMAFEASLRFKTAAELGASLRNIAATRIATGSVVAARVAELAGERIRARRVELDPSVTGKRRLASDRALRTAKPGPAAAAAAAAAATPAPASAAGPDRDTLPPGSMDPSDLGPASGQPLDLSVRDFIAAAEAPSAPALPAVAAPAPPPPVPQAPPPKPAAKPAPPLIRKAAPAAPPPVMKAPPAAPIQAAPIVVVEQPPIQAAPIVVVEQPAAHVAMAPAPAPWPDSAPALVAALAPDRAADPLPDPLGAPRGAYGLVTNSTPDAFTPTDGSPPRERRSPVAIFVGGALALLLLVIGFFAVRAMVAGSGTKTTAMAGASSGETTGNVTPTPSAEAAGDKPKDEAKAETPPAASSPSAAEPETTTTPNAEAPPAAATPETTAAAAAAGPAAAVRTPSEAAGAPGPAVKPPSSTPPKPKRPTYEPLGI